MVDEIANDTNTRILLEKPKMGAKSCVFSVTGKDTDVKSAQFIFQRIVKSHLKKLDTVKPITSTNSRPVPANIKDL